MSHPLFERHRALLERAVQAIHERSYWSAFAESPSPKAYGEGAAESGKAAFDALLGKRFPLQQPATIGEVPGERAPVGLERG
ncbi:MAG: phenylacetic acid degradation protein PaaN, partial [Burkholderiaceae bacterium]